MSDAEIAGHLAAAPDWSRIGHAIEKTFTFRSWPATMAFVNNVAAIADAEGHHPELTVSYGRCDVRWSTHSVGGLSINDFICAAKVDALPA